MHTHTVYHTHTHTHLRAHIRESACAHAHGSRVRESMLILITIGHTYQVSKVPEKIMGAESLVSPAALTMRAIVTLGCLAGHSFTLSVMLSSMAYKPGLRARQARRAVSAPRNRIDATPWHACWRYDSRYDQHSYIYIYIYIYRERYVCMHVYIYIYIHAHIYIYIYIYLYIHIIIIIMINIIHDNPWTTLMTTSM